MYQEIAVSSVADIPAAIASFANTVGWTVSGLNLTRPGGGDQFTLFHTIAGTNNQLKDVGVMRAADNTHKAYCRSPRLNGSSGDLPFVPNPSKIHCIGGLTPEPYIGVVIEFGFNLYRHLYIGNMEKLGSYTGGEVFSASNFPDTNSSLAFTINYLNNFSVQNLFSGSHVYEVALNSGGVKVLHADSAVTWRKFKGAVGFGQHLGQTTESVWGGFNDSYNDALLARGKSTYAGAGILVPINSFVARVGGADPYFTMIGRPAGVRLVRMDGIDPSQAIEVGNKVWRCFPQFRKSDSSIVSRGSWWNATESSYLVGLAYLVED
jgi:hypothetical protein